MCKEGIEDGVILSDNYPVLYGNAMVIRYFFDNKKSAKCCILNDCGYSIGHLVRLALLNRCDYCNFR